MWPIRASVANLFSHRQFRLAYITEPAHWATRNVGENLARALSVHHRLPVRVTASPHGLGNLLLHFGSLPIFLRSRRALSQSQLLTIYHLSPEFRQQAELLQTAAPLRLIHTTNMHARRDLVALGIPEDKIRVIPLGVDDNLFQPLAGPARARRRAQLHIPKDAFVIGSFQKDGVGWQAGRQPKMIKGPDILVDTLRQLAPHYSVIALLTGPARGYVCERLQHYHLPFRYAGFLPSQAHISPYYGALDAYLITSRVEGGPQQLLEAWASGVPVVSPAVGMVADLASHQHDALITASDPRQLASAIARLIDHPELRAQLSQAGKSTVRHFTWPAVAQRYVAELYQPLL